MTNNLLRYALLALTGIIHIYVGVYSQTIDFLLLLNGLGYLGLIGLDIVVEYRGYGGTNHLLLTMLYTAVTFVGYFVIWLPQQGLNLFSQQPLGIFTKIVELVLMILIYRELA